MLRDRGDDMIAFFFVHLGDTFNRQVVALGSARGEDDFFRRCADQLGDPFASRLHALFRHPTERMIPAGSIAKLLPEIRQHLFKNPRVDWSGRVVIHVNRQLNDIWRCVLLVLLLDWGNLIHAHDLLSLKPQPR